MKKKTRQVKARRAHPFIVQLDAKIEFHRNNENDRYGISNAVICALMEVRSAYAEALSLVRPTK